MCAYSGTFAGLILKLLPKQQAVLLKAEVFPACNDNMVIQRYAQNLAGRHKLVCRLDIRFAWLRVS